MTLDVSSLDRALAQLKETLSFAESDLAKNEPRIALQFRASSIQAFEYKYELTIKMLIRYLEATERNPDEIDKMSFQQILRLAYERGLVESELKTWLDFRKQRATTSQSYDERQAETVFRAIPLFLREAQFVYAEIQRRQTQKDA